MKNYIIENKVNPTDNWKKCKQFDDLDKAKQSLETLKKNVSNLFKNTEYDKYRLYDRTNNTYSY